MNKNKSFTLIELLVVIVIIGILAGVIMISTSSSIDKANFAKAQAFSNTVQEELLLNLVSEWTFDNSSNYGEDVWGNNDGGVHGTTPQLEENCVFGKCLGFNGSTSDYISISDVSVFNFQAKMSGALWIKGGPQLSRAIFGQYDSGANKRSWRIRSGSPDTSKILVNVSQTGTSPDELSSTVNVLDNVWHFIVFTFNSGEIKLYVDGRLDASKTSTYVLLLYNSDGDISLGCNFSNNLPSEAFNGLLDDVRIYNTALSSAQIKQDYILGLNLMLAKESISKEDYDQRINELAYE